MFCEYLGLVDEIARYGLQLIGMVNFGILSNQYGPNLSKLNIHLTGMVEGKIIGW